MGNDDNSGEVSKRVAEVVVGLPPTARTSSQNAYIDHAMAMMDAAMQASDRLAAMLRGLADALDAPAKAARERRRAALIARLAAPSVSAEAELTAEKSAKRGVSAQSKQRRKTDG